MALQEKEKKMLIFLGIIVVVLGVYYLYDSIIPKFTDMQTRIDDYREKIQNAQTNYRALNKLREEIIQLDADIQKLKQYFPEEEPGNRKTYELIARLEELGKKLGITFSSLAYAGEVEGEGGIYKEVKMTIKPSQPLQIETLIKLLYAFDKYENILDIKQFNFSPTNEEKNVFNIEMSVSFYMLKPNALQE